MLLFLPEDARIPGAWVMAGGYGRNSWRVYTQFLEWALLDGWACKRPARPPGVLAMPAGAPAPPLPIRHTQLLCWKKTGPCIFIFLGGSKKCATWLRYCMATS